jgi:hypothetical protein
VLGGQQQRSARDQVVVQEQQRQSACRAHGRQVAALLLCARAAQPRVSDRFAMPVSKTYSQAAAKTTAKYEASDRTCGLQCDVLIHGQQGMHLRQGSRPRGSSVKLAPNNTAAQWDVEPARKHACRAAARSVRHHLSATRRTSMDATLNSVARSAFRLAYAAGVLPPLAT